jgi:16S rRNA (cytidine1402-2'-O)-methyltransferase
LAALAADERTFIIYESPLRLLKTLQELAGVCGQDRDASVSREISKIHNTTHNGTLGELIEYFTQNNPRGEIVIVVAGNRAKEEKKVHRNKYRQNDDE